MRFPAGLKRSLGLCGPGEAVQLEGRLQHVFGERADDGFGLLAGLEERYGRDAGDAEVAGEGGLGVHVDLGDLESTVVLGGDLVHHRGDLPTRPTPRRPEVHQYGDLGIQNFVFEGVNRYCYGLRHTSPPHGSYLFFSIFRCQGAFPAMGRVSMEPRGDVVRPGEAGATGLEPAASGVTGRRSNQLNYAPAQGTVEFIKRGCSFLTYVYIVSGGDGCHRHTRITVRGFPLSRE